LWEENDGVNISARSPPFAWPPGELHHVAWTRDVDSGVHTFFLDGLAFAAVVQSGAATGGELGQIRIGGNSADSSLDALGVLDEVRVSGDVKSIDDIGFQVRTMRGEVATLGPPEFL
jgi:hypothetical protein